MWGVQGGGAAGLWRVCQNGRSIGQCVQCRVSTAVVGVLGDEGVVGRVFLLVTGERAGTLLKENRGVHDVWCVWSVTLVTVVDGGERGEAETGLRAAVWQRVQMGGLVEPRGSRQVPGHLGTVNSRGWHWDGVGVGVLVRWEGGGAVRGWGE